MKNFLKLIFLNGLNYFSLQTRFEQFQKYKETFGFLFRLERLRYIAGDN